jgi:hypothetical protein
MMNKAKKTKGQLIAKLQHMKAWKNENRIQHITYADIDEICEHLKESIKLEKALDKACERLEDKDNIMCEWAEIEPEDVWTAAQWKKLFLEGESEHGI